MRKFFKVILFTLLAISLAGCQTVSKKIDDISYRSFHFDGKNYKISLLDKDYIIQDD